MMAAAAKKNVDMSQVRMQGGFSIAWYPPPPQNPNPNPNIVCHGVTAGCKEIQTNNMN